MRTSIQLTSYLVLCVPLPVLFERFSSCKQPEQRALRGKTSALYWEASDYERAFGEHERVWNPRSTPRLWNRPPKGDVDVRKVPLSSRRVSKFDSATSQSSHFQCTGVDGADD